MFFTQGYYIGASGQDGCQGAVVCIQAYKHAWHHVIFAAYRTSISLSFEGRILVPCAQLRTSLSWLQSLPGLQGKWVLIPLRTKYIYICFSPRLLQYYLMFKILQSSQGLSVHIHILVIFSLGFISNSHSLNRKKSVQIFRINIIHQCKFRSK